jgi:hypothetical protein
MQILFRYIVANSLFHGFEVGAERSLCGYHEANRNRQPIAELQDLEGETVCPFCKAVVNRLKRHRSEALGTETRGEG